MSATNVAVTSINYFEPSKLKIREFVPQVGEDNPSNRWWQYNNIILSQIWL
ncbi:MAG: hypothetical protein HWQ38_10925 [Nostoc sp. NMS7]|uniref:hypothetical protein n=1 Tax=unclassified Nostoc TaxID=2593658 RepID=UPI0025E6D29C|nr:hypothetical protein [Nostoc sp. NMS7]MBN3946967.1 hypothetical protein [Nostoc sp. NMS7]